MSKIRGKKFTVEQMKLIQNQDDSINLKDWLYHSEEYVDDSGNKQTSRNLSKTRYMKIINRSTGEIKRIEM